MSTFLFNFKAQFAPAVECGAKLQTIRQRRKDFAGAVEQWKSLSEIDPGYQDLFARMAIASYYAQDYGSAWKYLADADLRHQPVPPQFRGLLREVAPRP